MNYTNISNISNISNEENDYINISHMKRNVCCFCCKRYTYALCNYNSKIIDTYNEEKLLKQHKINNNLWNTYIGDKLRLKINICFLSFTTVGLVLSYFLRVSDFVIISEGLNELSGTNEYSYLEINDIILLLCNIFGVGLCIYSVNNWVNKEKMNKCIKIAWFIFSLSIFIQIVIPPYYIFDVLYSSIDDNISKLIIEIIRVMSNTDNDDYNEVNSNYYTLNETYDDNNSISLSTVELLIKIVETYMNALGNCIIFIIMLPFIFRNNAVEISKIDKTYSKTASVLHIIMSFTEVFISIIVCNMIFMFGTYYWISVCFAISYNLMRQIQYFTNTKTIMNILMIIVIGLGFTLISLYDISFDSFIVNFLNSYFINKTAIQTIIYNKNKNDRQIDDNHIELLHYNPQIV